MRSPSWRTCTAASMPAAASCWPPAQPGRRGWHLDEAHIEIDGAPISGSLFDFGLFAFHNAQELLARGTGPYFYLPKMQSHREAALWRDVFLFAEKALDVPRGSMRATALIETLPAAFE